MATVRRPGPPVPPRPQTILLKARTVDASRTLSSITASSNCSPVATSTVSTITSAVAPEDGRTVVYKSPSFNLQKRQEQREKRYSFNIADGYYGSTVVVERGFNPPPLQVKPTVATKRPKPTAPVPAIKEHANNNSLSAIDNLTEIVIAEKNNNEIPVLANPPPQPKPRTLISKSPGGFLRRSKTTLDIFTRSTINNGNISNGDTNNNCSSPDTGSTHSRISNGFMSGKTFDIKNNLKNAAERLFSEIVSHSKDSKYQTKSLNPLPALHRSDLWKSKDTLPIEPDANGNCTRINLSPCTARLEDPIPPEKKIVFQEMLISELAAMRKRSNSVDQLNSRSDYSILEHHNRFSDDKSGDEKGYDERSVGDKSIDDKSMDDSGTGSALTLSLNESNNKTKRVRQRCPSGCSTDSSPCGMERSRIRTSDWIEVGENGKEEVMTSCQISLEDSGMEDEERPDDGSSGVGDSWDSVKEAKNEEERETRLRERRKITMADLPPLPKSLSTNQTFNESTDVNLECENETVATRNGGEVIGSTLDKQLSVLRKEMYGLRQLDISLLSQLWTLNDSIQNFRTMLDDQECYSPSPPQSPSPSPYDSVSSEAEDDLSPSIQTQIQHRSEIGISNQTPNRKHSQSSTNASPRVIPSNVSPLTFETSTSLVLNQAHIPITTQPTLRNSTPPTPTPRTPVKVTTPTSCPRQVNSKTLPPPPAPPTTKPPVERLSARPASQSFTVTSANKHLQIPVPVQRMRIAPPPPPVQRRAIVPPSRDS